MSGGSLNYLGYRDVDELVEHRGDIRDAISESEDDVLNESMNSLLDDIETSLARWRKHWEPLKPVIHSLEWWRSGDSGEEEYQQELDKWKAGLLR